MEIQVKLNRASYPIIIERNLMQRIGAQIAGFYKGKKIAVITDSNVKPLYCEMVERQLTGLGFQVLCLEVAPGEASKSMRVAENLIEQLLDFGMDRKGLIVNLGGGIVGDLGGFVASVFLRGIQYVQVPTSLLAQIDSSVGGKVAVNSSRGKNLIGNFYQPSMVLIDPEFLKTLDDRYFSDGMAELIKYGAIRDAEMFDALMAFEGPSALKEEIEGFIHKCCAIKAEIVEMDEKESGERKLLNFGHTLGHGIEKIFRYETYSHGEAVAIGMYMITKNSERLGLTEKGSSAQIKALLQKYGLKESVENLDVKKMIEIISLDKKSEGEFLELILLESIGRAFIKKIEKKHIEAYCL